MLSIIPVGSCKSSADKRLKPKRLQDNITRREHNGYMDEQMNEKVVSALALNNYLSPLLELECVIDQFERRIWYCSWSEDALT